MMLNEPYNKDAFNQFLKGFLPDYKIDERDVRTPNGSILIHVTQLGISRSRILDVTVLEAECEETAANKRIAITQASFKVLRDHQIRNAIVAFYNNRSQQWRLSLLTSTLQIKDGKVVKKHSNPRRYSYLLGIGAKTHTPHKFLIDKGRVENIKQLQERFSTEVVSKQFYISIAELFTKLVGGKRGKITYPGLLKINDNLSRHIKRQEFAVRLIGRIIFSWFLKEKKSASGTPIIPKELLSLDAVANNHDYYHSVLELLFFELLNKRVESRDESINTRPFSTVPYLNGGLFDPQDDDYYNRGSSIAGTPSPVYIPDSWFTELFIILEQYNFTVDENTSYDVDLSIDPEMLGRIFENLLAEISPETGESARKSTGSFYTPREIVEYMVDSSLLEFLKNKTHIDEAKLKALVSWGQADDDEYPLTNNEKRIVVNALAGLTILDPACGSGAFPIGILQKVVYILQQTDPNAEIWLESQLKNISSPELRRNIREKYANKNYDWLRKLGVIRKSIFGIDIQEIATEISRLRCFLSLIIEEDVDDDNNGNHNRGVHPLPNLDFNFVTANSLVSAPQAKAGAGPTLFDDTYKQQLSPLVDSYFSSTGEERYKLVGQIKDMINEKVNETKNLILNDRGIIQDNRFQDAYRQIKMASYKSLLEESNMWESYKNIFSHEPIDFFDKDLMFPSVGEGFDIVIGNPPYIDSETMVKVMPQLREQYKEHYDVARGNWDLYIVFYGFALKQLAIDGTGCLITPNQWLTLQYGKALRSVLSSRIIHFADMRAYSDFTANVNTFVTTFTKKPRAIEAKVEYRLFSNTGSYQINVMTSKQLCSLSNFGILTSSHYHTVEKINALPNRCSAIFHCGTGYVVNDYYVLTDLISNKPHPDMNKEFKLVNTGILTNDIQHTNWGIKELKHVNRYLFPVVDKDKFASFFPKKMSSQNTAKVIVSESSGIKIFVDEYGYYLADKVTSSIIPNQKSDIWLVGRLLNSKLFRWYYDQVFSAGGMMGTTVNGSALVSIPLPSNESVASLRHQLTKQADESTVNYAIYEHYNLNPEEITIIENETK